MKNIKDVADKAGVSVKTVSRALSDKNKVAQKTRDRIYQIMEEMEYYPSAAAQSLRGRQKGIVSVIGENLTTSPDSFEIIAGIQAACESSNNLLMIGETGGNEKSFEKLVNDFRQQRAQAIIYATKYHKEVKISQSFNSCPLILVNCFEADLKHPTILPNDKVGAFKITHELINLGHKRIAYLTLFNDMPATKLRLQGFLDAHKLNDIAHDSELVIEGVIKGTRDELSALPECLDKLMNSAQPPTAIMCGNDKMAMRTYMLIRRKGYKIPEDVSVIGYDDYKLISESLLPNLTTVSLPYFDMGKRAAKLALSKSTKQEVYQVSGEVILRDSHKSMLD